MILNMLNLDASEAEILKILIFIKIQKTRKLFTKIQLLNEHYSKINNFILKIKVSNF